MRQSRTTGACEKHTCKPRERREGGDVLSLLRAPLPSGWLSLSTFNSRKAQHSQTWKSILGPMSWTWISLKPAFRVGSTGKPFPTWDRIWKASCPWYPVEHSLWRAWVTPEGLYDTGLHPVAEIQLSQPSTRSCSDSPSSYSREVHVHPPSWYEQLVFGEKVLKSVLSKKKSQRIL